MNMHAAQNDLAKAELLNLASVPRQIISPANNQSIIGIFFRIHCLVRIVSRRDNIFATNGYEFAYAL